MTWKYSFRQRHSLSFSSVKVWNSAFNYSCQRNALQWCESFIHCINHLVYLSFLPVLKPECDACDNCHIWTSRAGWRKHWTENRQTEWWPNDWRVQWGAAKHSHGCHCSNVFGRATRVLICPCWKRRDRVNTDYSWTPVSVCCSSHWAKASGPDRRCNCKPFKIKHSGYLPKIQSGLYYTLQPSNYPEDEILSVKDLCNFVFHNARLKKLKTHLNRTSAFDEQILQVDNLY